MCHGSIGGYLFMLLTCPKRKDDKPHFTYIYDEISETEENTDGSRFVRHYRKCAFCGYVINEHMYDRKQVSANGEDDI